MVIGSVFGRFVEKVDIQGPDDCWEWQAYTLPSGYGNFKMNGKTQLAHRVAWELTHGESPGELDVLHSCDNPSCVNPDHLFLGTQEDNARDMVNKARVAKGQNQGSAKLTEPEVIEIRRSSKSQRKLASEYGVSRAQIHRIRAGLSWGWLNG